MKHLHFNAFGKTRGYFFNYLRIIYRGRQTQINGQRDYAVLDVAYSEIKCKLTGDVLGFDTEKFNCVGRS